MGEWDLRNWDWPPLAGSAVRQSLHTHQLPAATHSPTCWRRRRRFRRDRQCDRRCDRRCPQVQLTDTHLLLATEHAAGGRLSGMVASGQGISEQLACWVLQQVTSAVYYRRTLVSGPPAASHWPAGGQMGRGSSRIFSLLSCDPA